MDPLMKEEEYNWREVILPSLILVVPEPELERETGERRRGRDIIIAVDHGPNSKHAFHWAITHLCRLADTVHLVLMEKLAVEALEVAMVKSKARIVEGDAGKAICKEAGRLKPAAVVLVCYKAALVNIASTIVKPHQSLLFLEKNVQLHIFWMVPVLVRWRHLPTSLLMCISVQVSWLLLPHVIYFSFIS
ncbi:unnamed protein product [Fraxinus pennsylvanica]|uniref:UspA domain-containing protein n=1 Tax=Fraxinus pennsylvanica TaxID=56036 RepID=A0AAD2E3T3_9LAMI|nr:unnamed protein product [Fraxinus pennsylvanica]